MLIDKLALKVTKAVATEEHRPGLTGVHVKNGYVEATNGHILVRIPLPNMPSEEAPEAWKGVQDKMEGVILNSKDLQAVGKRLDGKTRLPILACAGIGRNGERQAMAHFGLEGDSQSVQVIEATYPDTDQIWPKENKKYSHTVSIASQYLRMLADLADDKQEAVILHFDKDNTKPIAFEIRNDRPVKGIVMPMRM